MAGEKINRSAQRIGVDAVGETRTGERLRLDAMCRHCLLYTSDAADE